MLQAKINYYFKELAKIRQESRNNPDPLILMEQIDELIMTIHGEEENIYHWPNNLSPKFNFISPELVSFFIKKLGFWLGISLLGLIFLLASVAQITYFAPLAIGGSLLAVMFSLFMASRATIKNNSLLQEWLKIKFHVAKVDDYQEYQKKLDYITQKLLVIKNNLKPQNNFKDDIMPPENSQINLLEDLKLKYRQMEDNGLKATIKSKITTLTKLMTEYKTIRDPFKKDAMLKEMALIWEELAQIDVYLNQNQEKRRERTKR